MADKVAHHNNEILSVSQAKTGTFKEKVGKIFLEVVIIVFSILVSLWLANWNDKRKERVEVKEFLMDLKEDLVEDTALIKRLVKQLEVKAIISNAERFSYIMVQVCNASVQQADSLMKVSRARSR